MDQLAEMERIIIGSRVRSILREEFDISHNVSGDARLEDHLHLDILDRAELLFFLEEEFGIRTAVVTIRAEMTIDDLVKIVYALLTMNQGSKEK
ncbi:MAG: hypothetical protein ACOC32_02305 [Nanoarchaeota archaeon]